jgi:hypothetical protein
VTPELGETLARVADALAEARQPWWIIGSAAVALHGADVTVGDVDVLLGEADARGAAAAGAGCDGGRGERAVPFGGVRAVDGAAAAGGVHGGVRVSGG